MIRVLVGISAVAFALSVLGTLVAPGVFFYYDTDFWSVFDVNDVNDVMGVVAVLLFGLTVSPGVLYPYFRGRESYPTFESVVLLAVFAIALLNLLWVLPTALFG